MSNNQTIEQPAETGLMKTAKIRLGLNKGHTVTKLGVTPAQLQLLITMHMRNYGDNPILEVVETDAIPRTPIQEVSRLRGMYGRARVQGLFGINAELPATFENAQEAGRAWSMENPAGEGEPMVGRRLTTEEASAFLG